MNQQVVSYDCEFCEAKCQDSGDLKRHWTTYHCPETALEEFESGQFQCDICPLNYTQKRDLEFHERECHWGQFW